MKKLNLLDLKNKICLKCEIKKDITEFYKSKNNKDGLNIYCKECCKETNRKYHRKNPNYNKEYRLIHPYKAWASITLRTHRYKGNIVNITAKELTELGKNTIYCPICGIKIDYNYPKPFGKSQSNSPSLDRKDNENTLNLDNIWVICRDCNIAKYIKTMNEFIDYCEMVYKKFKKV